MIGTHAEPVPLLTLTGRVERLAAPRTAVVVGGGIAGLAAATVLAERGMQVTVLEREHFLGGRAGAWSDTLQDGTRFEMERGFHAFFRQYYNLRQLIRRVDPQLGCLVPTADYPILTPDGGAERFSGLPNRAPLNVAALTWRTETLKLADLLRINKTAALEMLRFDREQTFARFDRQTSQSYLDSLRFPPLARQRLFHVFAHSCFNPQEDMSAAELLQMFHFYFTGNREGLIFDVSNRPFSHAIFAPLGNLLEQLGAEVRCGVTVRGIERAGERWVVCHADGVQHADAVVLATEVPGLQRIVAASSGLDDATWVNAVRSLRATSAFAVWRLWLDRPVHSGRALFAGTAGVGRLDNISLYHLFEDESRDWAARTGGAVVELHAYALPEGIAEAELRADLLAGLHTLYPETRTARIVEQRWLVRADCPSFAPGSYATRPGVATPFAGLALAGDFVKLPLPSALMERAAASGFLAASTILNRYDVRPEPLWSITPRGLLARFLP
jgi:isorenieratene synthase